MRRSFRLLGGLLATIALLSACSRDSSEPDDAFYLEAQVTVTGADRPDSRFDVDGRTVTGLRWWYRDATHYRHQFYQQDAMFEWGPAWSVADGDRATSFDPRTGATQFHELAGGSPPYPSMSALIGPLPTDTLDGFIEEWRGRVGHVERAGSDELLGRTVTVVEYGPTWSAASSEQSAATSGGLGRFYVDEEAGFILRNVVDGGPERQSFDAEVTLLDPSPTFDDGQFEAVLPEGAVEDVLQQDCRTSGPSGGSGLPGPSLIRFPVPSGWGFEGGGGSYSAGCLFQEEYAGYARGSGEFLVITQRPVPPTGVPPVRADATSVEIDGFEGYRLTAGDIERLIWVQGDVIVLVESNAATFEELLRIAESGEAAP